MLRETRRAPPTGEWVSVSGADPLNLVGTIVPGPRVPALTGNRVLYRDGVAVATLVGGAIAMDRRAADGGAPRGRERAHQAPAGVAAAGVSRLDQP